MVAGQDHYRGWSRAGSGDFGQEAPQERRKDVVFFHVSLRDPLDQRWKA